MDFARNRQGTANDCPGRGEKGFKLNSSFSGKQWKTKRNVWESMGEDRQRAKVDKTISRECQLIFLFLRPAQNTPDSRKIVSSGIFQFPSGPIVTSELITAAAHGSPVPPACFSVAPALLFIPEKDLFLPCFFCFFGYEPLCPQLR